MLGYGDGADAGIVDEQVDGLDTFEDLGEALATESSLATSSSTSSTVTPASAAMVRSLAALSTERTVPNTCICCDARWMAVARPMPEFTPVTTATLELIGPS